jgi:DNA repair protein RadC
MLLTGNLRRAADLLGLQLMDHIILGRDRYFSFLEAGRL